MSLQTEPRDQGDLTFHLSWKLKASCSDMFLTTKSLNRNQGLDRSKDSASGTSRRFEPIIQEWTVGNAHLLLLPPSVILPVSL